MRDYYETRLQIAVADYLKGEIRQGKNVLRLQAPFPGLLFAHIPNEIKEEKEVFWAVRKGLLKGIADFVLWDSIEGTPLSMAIELKSKEGRLSPAQRQFQCDFEAKGGLYAICRTVAEVRDILIKWGLKCKNGNVIEPRLSHEELLAMQREIYKR